MKAVWCTPIQGIFFSYTIFLKKWQESLLFSYWYIKSSADFTIPKKVAFLYQSYSQFHLSVFSGLPWQRGSSRGLKTQLCSSWCSAVCWTLVLVDAASFGVCSDSCGLFLLHVHEEERSHSAALVCVFRTRRGQVSSRTPILELHWCSALLSLSK